MKFIFPESFSLSMYVFYIQIESQYPDDVISSSSSRIEEEGREGEEKRDVYWLGWCTDDENGIRLIELIVG